MVLLLLLLAYGLVCGAGFGCLGGCYHALIQQARYPGGSLWLLSVVVVAVAFDVVVVAVVVVVVCGLLLRMKLLMIWLLLLLF